MAPSVDAGYKKAGGLRTAGPSHMMMREAGA